jgi:UDP-glucose 4-epimerase
LNDVDAVTKACEDVEVIFREAALPSVPRSVKDPWASNDANINGTLRLLISAVAAGVKRVIYAGSSSAYGETPKRPRSQR